MKATIAVFGVLLLYLAVALMLDKYSNRPTKWSQADDVAYQYGYNPDVNNLIIYSATADETWNIEGIIVWNDTPSEVIPFPNSLGYNDFAFGLNKTSPKYIGSTYNKQGWFTLNWTEE